MLLVQGPPREPKRGPKRKPKAIKIVNTSISRNVVLLMDAFGAQGVGMGGAPGLNC